MRWKSNQDMTPTFPNNLEKLHSTQRPQINFSCQHFIVDCYGDGVPHGGLGYSMCLDSMTLWQIIKKKWEGRVYDDDAHH